MVQKVSVKPLAFALGTVFATTLSATAFVNAADNPFAMIELSSGYQVAEAAEGKCGEGKCGGDKAGAEAGAKGEAEGKCGEGKCGGDKAGAEAGAKGEAEGKCGEGKCGGAE